jgi:hypothetical protein
MAHRRPRSEPELMRMLAQDTRSEVTVPEREYLRDRNLISDALAPDDDGYEFCLADLQIFRKRSRQSTQRGNRGKKAMKGGDGLARRLAEAPTEQAFVECRVLARHFARHVQRGTKVRLVRRLLFGDPERAVSQAEAYDLLESPALRYLGPAYFTEHGIPVLGHSSRVTRVRMHEDAVRASEDVTLLIKWPGGSTRKTVRVEIENLRTGSGPQFLPLPRRNGPPWTADIYPGSFLWGVAGAVLSVKKNSLWDEAQTLWFMMTRVVPYLEPVQVHRKILCDEHRNPMFTALQIQTFPFVSARALFRTHALTRRWLLRKRRTRPPQISNLELFDFIEDRMPDPKATPKWSRLMAEWNRGAPADWKYVHRGHFRRDYLRVRSYFATAPR